MVELSPMELDYPILQGRCWFILVSQDSVEPGLVEAIPDTIDKLKVPTTRTYHPSSNTNPKPTRT